VFSENTIDIFIDGEKYSREYPDTLEEAVTLIGVLAGMHNALDKSFIEYREESLDEKNKLSIIIEELNSNNNELEKQLKVINAETDKILKNTRRVKNGIMAIASSGPIYNINENIFGVDVGLGGIFRIPIDILNMYAGLNLFTNIYHFYGEYKVMDVGASIYLGTFIK
jgi:hypothetical protein